MLQNSQLKIAHLTTKTFGGAGKTVVELHKALLTLGFASEIFCRELDPEIPKIQLESILT